MRIEIEFSIPLEYCVIPGDYRRAFISFIKQAIEKQSPEKTEEIYGKQTIKPFCFAIYLPDPMYCRRYVELHGDNIKMYISSVDTEILGYIMTGLIEARKFELFGIKTEITQIKTIKEREILTESATFRMMSPLVVAAKENSGRKYLRHFDKDFKAAVKRNILMVCERMGHKPNIFIADKRMKNIVIPHYEGKVCCNIGEIDILGPSGDLQYLYDLGIGSRRSQGFGMLEINDGRNT